VESRRVTDGKFCTYFFCGESLRATADRLKQPERQQPFKSPYNLLCSLVVHPFEHETTFSRIAIGIKKPLHFQLVRARYIQEAQAAYDAEVVLYSASDLTVNVCAQSGDMSLTIACPRSIATEVIAESTRLKSAFDCLLVEGFKKWSPYISSVRLLANSTMPLQRQSL